MGRSSHPTDACVRSRKEAAPKIQTFSRWSLILTTAADFTTQSKAELAKAAKGLKISGASSMSKEQLVDALTKAHAESGKASAVGASKGNAKQKGISQPAKPKVAAAKELKPKASTLKTESSTKPAAKSGKSDSSVTSSAKGDVGKAGSEKVVKSKESKPQKPTKAKADKVQAEATATTASPSPSKAKAKPGSEAKSGGESKSSEAASKLPKIGKAGGSPKAKSTAIGAGKEAAGKESKAAKGSRPAGPKITAAAGEATPAETKPKEKKPGKQTTKTASTTTTSPKVLKKIRELQQQRETGKDIAFRPTLVRPPGASEPIWEKEPQKDRIGLFVRDPYWLHASWDITRNAVDRARAALAEQWHTSKPVLRLLRLDDNSTSSPAETVERDIEIHGGLRNWYIPWTGAATSFRVLVGYLAANGRYHAIAKSNIVKTTAAGSPDAVDDNWSDLGPESERIYALSGGYDSEHETAELREILEERVHRNLGAPALAKLGIGTDGGGFRRRGDFHFDMEIELVVYGSTLPDGFLTLNGEPVTLRSDGSFAVRLPFPDRRQVLPAVACTRDGSQQRTIVVAVERNTKIMEPMEQERDTGD